MIAEEFLLKMPEEQRTIVEIYESRLTNLRNEKETEIERIQNEMRKISIPNTEELKKRGLTIMRDNLMQRGLYGIGKRVKMKIVNYKMPGQSILTRLPEELIWEKEVSVYFTFNIKGEHKGECMRDSSGKEMKIFHINETTACYGNEPKLTEIRTDPDSISEKIGILTELQETIDPTSLLCHEFRRGTKLRAIYDFLKGLGAFEEREEEEIEENYECEICGYSYGTENEAEHCCPHYHCQYCSVAILTGNECGCIRAEEERREKRQESENKEGAEQ